MTRSAISPWMNSTRSCRMQGESNGATCSLKFNFFDASQNDCQALHTTFRGLVALFEATLRLYAPYAPSTFLSPPSFGPKVLCSLVLSNKSVVTVVLLEVVFVIDLAPCTTMGWPVTSVQTLKFKERKTHERRAGRSSGTPVRAC
jgi:hypothetical protein